jgi:hypothetical protein
MALCICFEVNQGATVSEVEARLQTKVDMGIIEWFRVDVVSFKEAERNFKKNDLKDFDQWERKHVTFRKITFLAAEPFMMEF